MNLILLFDDDFTGEHAVRLSGRRRDHVTGVHRAAVGDSLVVGVAGGRIGRGRVTRLDGEALEMDVALDAEPPPALPLTLVLALPRPKVLNRVIAGAASLGVKRIHLLNAWRVEKSYWRSPRMSEENLRQQCILGLEQARDTILPTIEVHRLFRPFVETFTPEGLAVVAHPGAKDECPRAVREAVTLAIGPEGGFIGREVESLVSAGFTPVSLGPRILRVETAVPALIARIF
jgi:16S rRNA (uracil1498-N3)-methyltransferase